MQAGCVGRRGCLRPATGGAADANFAIGRLRHIDPDDYEVIVADNGSTQLSAQEPWGWKDPRNSLTLPFWMRLIPNLKVVICLRNPLEVAQSLHLRNSRSIAFGLRLWLAHNQRILSAVKAEDCVVTHYDAYFDAPKAELVRVLYLLNAPASEKQIDEACSTVSANLRHQRVPIEVVSPEVPPEILKCYLELCEQAGPVYQASWKARR